MNGVLMKCYFTGSVQKGEKYPEQAHASEVPDAHAANPGPGHQHRGQVNRSYWHYL